MIIDTSNYDLNCWKMSTDGKIIATKNVNTVSTVDAVLTFCSHQNLEILHYVDIVLKLC